MERARGRAARAAHGDALRAGRGGGRPRSPASRTARSGAAPTAATPGSAYTLRGRSAHGTARPRPRGPRRGPARGSARPRAVRSRRARRGGLHLRPASTVAPGIASAKRLAFSGGMTSLCEPRQHASWAATSARKRERIDRLGVEHSPVPAKPPAVLDLLDRPFGDELQLVRAQNRRATLLASRPAERLAVGLDALRRTTRARGERSVLVGPVALDVDGQDAADPVAAARRVQADVPTERDGPQSSSGRAQSRSPASQRMIVLVIRVAVRVAVLAEAVTSKVEATTRTPRSNGRTPQPVAEVTTSARAGGRLGGPAPCVRIGEPPREI